MVADSLRETNIDEVAKLSLGARIYRFFKSRTPAALRLKFHLTQGFYLTELLGLENAHFNPLAEKTFQGSVFYLDANVLLLGVLEKDEAGQPFREAMTLAKKLGITMTVTRATLDEIRKAAIDHVGQMRKFIDVLPERLTEQTDDQFLLAYFHLRSQTPSLTLDSYLDIFLSLDKVLLEKWMIEIDERSRDQVIQGRDPSEIIDAINAESDVVGRDRKSDTILEHDVFCYMLVVEARKVNRRSWFLTRDRILTGASKRLAGSDLSVCFSLVGFLHSISPFLTTGGEEKPFAELFGDILDLQIVANGSLFQANELAIIAEMHSDVLATPPEQLVMAFDFVKITELHGQRYHLADYGKVSLGLKKFLTSSKNDQLKSHEAELARLRLAQKEASSLKAAAEMKSDAQAAELALLRESLAESDSDKARLAERLQVSQSELQSRNTVRRILLASGLIFSSIAVIYFQEAILSSKISRFPESVQVLLGTLFELLCLSAVLVGFSKMIPLIIRKESLKKPFFLGVSALCVFLFTYVGHRDVSHWKNLIDLVLKIGEACVFFSMFNNRS